MSLHLWFGRYVPVPEAGYWEGAWFASRCAICGREMVRLPGMPWRVRGKGG